MRRNVDLRIASFLLMMVIQERIITVRIFSGCLDLWRMAFQNGPYTAWEHVSSDKREALASVVTGPARGASPFRTLRVKGLEPNLRYQVNGEGRWPGDVLMEAGWPLPVFEGDYQSLQLYLSAI